MSIRTTLWLMASLYCSMLPLAAQEARGTLLGRVTDPSEAVIAGAELEARNVETGVRFSSLTNRTGDYISPLLIPGSYSITVENPGFKTYTRTGIVVRVNDQVTINVSLKSGTNNLHGQVYYFMQNPVFTADNFFRLAAGKPQFRLYRWGGSISGPVSIPKLYDGHNRTFFMYGYEGIWSFDPSPWVVESVPTPAQRAGDLSDLLALGSRFQIYDPYSIAAAGNGRFSRSPVPSNRIPSSQINPVARKIAALWDLPNQAGTVDGTNNYTKGKNAQDTYWNHIVRVDHNVSEKQRFLCAPEFHGPAAAGEHSP